MDSICTKPPSGWTCSRPEGHSGPCAASPLPQPDGWAYRYGNGCIRFNGGVEVNGGRAVEAIPFYFGKPQLIIRAQ